MKRTMMVLLVAITLLTATGIATLAVYGTNGGDDEDPAGVHATPTEISPSTDAESTASSKPGVGVGSDWPKPIPKLAGDSDPGTEPMIASSKPGIGAGSGGIKKKAGAEIAGGRGGIFGDC